MLTVTLPPDLEAFAAAAVASGRYATPEDLVSRAVRLLRATEMGADDAREAEASDSGSLASPPTHRPPRHDRERARAAAVGLREVSRGVTLGPVLTARDLLEAGRRGEA